MQEHTFRNTHARTHMHHSNASFASPRVSSTLSLSTSNTSGEKSASSSVFSMNNRFLRPPRHISSSPRQIQRRHPESATWTWLIAGNSLCSRCECCWLKHENRDERPKLRTVAIDWQMQPLVPTSKLFPISYCSCRSQRREPSSHLM